MHQPLAMLQWLDPPLEPTQSRILAGETHLHEFGDPPSSSLEQRVAGYLRGHIPALDLLRNNVLEWRKTLGFAWRSLIFAVEKEAIPEPGGLVRSDEGKDSIFSDLQGYAGGASQRIACPDRFFLDAKEVHQKIDARADSQVAFADCDKARQGSDAVRGDVMGLHLESVQHLSEELRWRKGKPSVDQGLGDHPLALSWCGKRFVSHEPPCKLLLDVSLGLKILHVGSFQFAWPPFSFVWVGGIGIIFFLFRMLDVFRLSLSAMA